MKFTDPKSPGVLQVILKQIPKEPTEVTYGFLQIMECLFREGGVICETFEEVVRVLERMEEWYGWVELKQINDETLTIRNTYGY
jgi:hypothetical protein